MKKEDFYKYFLYGLLDTILMDFRFDARPDELEELKKEKIWALTHFLIELPYELYKGTITEEENFYYNLAQTYEKYSLVRGLHSWFVSERNIRYSFFCRKYNLNPEAFSLAENIS